MKIYLSCSLKLAAYSSNCYLLIFRDQNMVADIQVNRCFISVKSSENLENIVCFIDAKR